MTSNDNAVVDVLVSCTSSTGTSTHFRQVVGLVDAEAMDVVSQKTVHQACTTEVCIQDTGVFVLEHFDEHRVQNEPATTSVNILLIQAARHTCNDLQRCSSNSRNRSSTSQAWCEWDRVVASRSSGDVREVTLFQLVNSQQFVSTSSSVCFGAVDSGVDSVCSRVARQVLQHVGVHCVSHFIGSTICGQVHEVDVAVGLFDVIQFECKVVSFVDGQLEVSVNKVLGGHSGTTSKSVNSDVRLFHDANRVALSRDFTEVVVVGDCVYDCRLTECNLCFLRENLRREVPVVQVGITRCLCECHCSSPIDMTF